MSRIKIIEKILDILLDLALLYPNSSDKAKIQQIRNDLRALPG